MVTTSTEPRQGHGSTVSPTDNLTELLTERDVARIIAMSVATVRRLRWLRQPPRWVKIGSAVRYRPEDISAWLAAQPTGGSPDSTQSGPPQFVKGGK